jgi:adenylylsulfate kinase
MQENIIPTQFKIVRETRNNINGHRSFVIWFTGLSGSGKSTIADSLEQKLHDAGIRTFILDGDNIRKGINKDLTFSDSDRTENLRRIGEIAKLMGEAGLVVLAAFISPFKKDRQLVRDIIGDENFIEVFVNTRIEVCEERDIKGLYKKARNGFIPDFTGISSPYEKPDNPDIELTENNSVEDAVSVIFEYIKHKL